MSGIAGLWNRDGRPVEPGILSRMSETLRHRGPDGDGQWREGPVALAHRAFRVTPQAIDECQPLAGPTGAVVAFDGRLDNREALAARLGLGRAQADQRSDSALALTAYERWGVPFAAALLGDFALAIYDHRMARLVLVRDAIGVRPIYYHRGPRLFAFGSEIKALLTHPDIPRVPDVAGLADALRVGRGPDQPQLTCFAGIWSLRPGHVAVIGPDHWSVERYWDFNPARRVRHSSADAYFAEFRERFATAVRRRMRTASPVAVSVSGGLDSSAVFSQAQALCVDGTTPCPRVAGISYVAEEHPEADESIYLSALEQRFSARIDRLRIEPLLGVRAGIDEQIWHVESPSPEALWGVTRAVGRAACAHGARMLLTGHWGDQVLFAPAYLIDLTRRFAWRSVARHLAEYHKWFDPGEADTLRRFFMSDLLRYHIPAVLMPWLRSLRRFVKAPSRRETLLGLSLRSGRDGPAGRTSSVAAGPFHSAHAASLYREVRSAYSVQCLEWNNKAAALNGVEIAFPMLDRDLLEYLMAVPGEEQSRDGIPRRMLRESMRGVLPDTIAARTGKGNISRVVNRSVQRDFDGIAAALSQDAPIVRLGYVARDALRSALDRAGADLTGGTCTGAWDVIDLLGFDAWLRVFFDGVPGVPSSMSEVGGAEVGARVH